MTFVLGESFDTYNGTGANTGLQAKWSPVNLNGASTASLVSGRFGGQALRISNTTTNTGVSGYNRTLPSSYGSMAVEFGFRISSLAQVITTTNIPIICTFVETATYHVHITVSSDGKLNAYRASSSFAGTLLGTTSAQVIFNNTWHSIGIELVISDTVGRVTIYVDGVQVLNLTGQDTKNGGAGTINVLCVACNSQSTASAPNCDFDDVQVHDVATRVAEMKAETLYPTSDVAQGFSRSTGATNYTLVDETTVNGDTDYVQASAVSTVDTYGFGDLSTTPANIYAVQVVAFAEKTDATSRSIALQIISGATTSDGADFALASSYGRFERLTTIDPNTAAAWTPANVNAITAGPKVTV